MVTTVVAIIHAPALKARDQHVRNMCEAFTACGATPVVVMGPEPPLSDPVTLATMVNMDASKLGDAVITSVFHPLMQDLKVRQVSNALKHVAAIQYIAAQDCPINSWHIILEDDAMIVDAAALVYACTSAPEDADIIFFGIPSELPHPTKSEVRYDPLSRITLLPACDSYAVRMHTARFLSTSMLPIKFKTEIHLSWLLARSCIKTYITSPNLSVDGSKVGMFVSTIEPNNTLCFNSEYVALANSLNMDISAFITRVTDMPFGGHPDAQVLLGLRQAACGNHSEAMSLFADALAVYTAEGAVIGNDTSFLRVYMDLFKHSQNVT